MIQVETDLGPDWDAGRGWEKLAEDAVQAAVAASDHAGLLEAGIAVEVSVKFASDEEVTALNGSYRGKDRPTNVLSFPMLDAALIEPVGRADGGEVLLGDVVLAHGVCKREAAGQGVEIRTHAAHLIVHGTLHLLCYDHESGEEAAETMEDAEKRALAALGIADPYAVQEVQS